MVLSGIPKSFYVLLIDAVDILLKHVPEHDLCEGVENTTILKAKSEGEDYFEGQKLRRRLLARRFAVC